ncbi:MAG: hypothetical protein ABSF61_01290 [Anaerolineales bacterium]
MATWWSIKEDEGDRRAPSPWAQAAIASVVLILGGVYLLTPLRIAWFLDSYGWLRQFIHILLVHGV